jgi:hypothetical protein
METMIQEKLFGKKAIERDIAWEEGMREEVVWLEILSRRRAVVTRHRCLGAEIRVGRSYANDFILDDPAVSLDHLVIRHEPGGSLVAESEDGFYRDGSVGKLHRAQLDGDRPIRVGQTLIRVRTPDYAVPATLSPIATATPTRLPSLPYILAASAAAVGLTLLQNWLGDYGQPKLQTYLLSAFMMAILAMAWAGAWALASRAASGRGRFDRNLLITFGAIVASTVLSMLVEFLTYSLSWDTAHTYSFIVFWLLFGAVILAHLRSIGPTRLAVKAMVVGIIAVVGIGFQTFTTIELRSVTGYHGKLALLPPSLRLTPAVGGDAFLARAQELKSQLERDRQRPIDSGIF